MQLSLGFDVQYCRKLVVLAQAVIQEGRQVDQKFRIILSYNRASSGLV